MSPSDAKRRKDTSIMAKEDLKTGFTKHTIEFKAAPYAKLERPQVTYYIAIFVLICILPQKTFGVLNANLEKLSEAEVFQSCTD
jgi:hypothetical protein